MEVFIISIAIIIYLAIFIFGYREDYKRNPKEFVRTIIGMPIAFFFANFGFKDIEEKIKKWTESKS